MMCVVYDERGLFMSGVVYVCMLAWSGYDGIGLDMWTLSGYFGRGMDTLEGLYVLVF